MNDDDEGPIALLPLDGDGDCSGNRSMLTEFTGTTVE